MNRSLALAIVLLFVGCDTEKPAETTVRDSDGQHPSEDRHAAPESDRVEVRRLDGTLFNPLAEPADAKARVFVFLTTDCPIANRYAPTLQRLAVRCAQDNVAFKLVYPNTTDSVDDIREHLKQYSHNCDAVRDTDHLLVRKTGATVTPEAAVFDAAGAMQYRGRIDDWYVAFGRNRREPTTHDLDDAITAVLAGVEVPENTTKAIGCYIPDLAEARNPD